MMSRGSDANKAVIEALFATTNEGGDILPFLADDATWWVPGHWALGGTYRKDELGPIFDKVFALMDIRPHFTINAITAEDDRVGVDCDGKGRFKDGTLYHNTYHFLFRLSDGKVVSGKEFMNTAYMSQTLADQLSGAGHPA
jgi:ketosteroid isomerase-like protein